jgi:hypothetical protein
MVYLDFGGSFRAFVTFILGTDYVHFDRFVIGRKVLTMEYMF